MLSTDIGIIILKWLSKKLNSDFSYKNIPFLPPTNCQFIIGNTNIQFKRKHFKISFATIIIFLKDYK